MFRRSKPTRGRPRVRPAGNARRRVPPAPPWPRSRGQVQAGAWDRAARRRPRAGRSGRCRRPGPRAEAVRGPGSGSGRSAGRSGRPGPVQKHGSHGLQVPVVDYIRNMTHRIKIFGLLALGAALLSTGCGRSMNLLNADGSPVPGRVRNAGGHHSDTRCSAPRSPLSARCNAPRGHLQHQGVARDRPRHHCAAERQPPRGAISWRCRRWTIQAWTGSRGPWGSTTPTTPPSFTPRPRATTARRSCPAGRSSAAGRCSCRMRPGGESCGERPPQPSSGSTGCRSLVYAVHLETMVKLSDPKRSEQARAVTEDAKGFSGPVVIAGDFNDYAMARPDAAPGVHSGRANGWDPPTWYSRWITFMTRGLVAGQSGERRRGGPESRAPAIIIRCGPC